MTIGQRIKQRRKELGLTQTELAHRLGNKSKVSVCTVENDKEDLTTDRIRKYADALECTPAYLMGWVNDPTSLMKKLDIDIDDVPKKHYKDFVLMSDEERIIIECYRTLKDDQKEMAKRLLMYDEKLKELSNKNTERSEDG